MNKEIEFYNEYSKCQSRYSRLKVKRSELMAVITVIEDFDEIFTNIKDCSSEHDLEKYWVNHFFRGIDVATF